MRHYLSVWALSGAVGGAIVGLARPGLAKLSLATLDEFGLSALVHGVLGAAVGAVLGLLLMVLARIAREQVEPDARLRSAGILMPAAALALVLRAALTESGGAPAFPPHAVFLTAVLLSIGIGSLIALRPAQYASKLAKFAGLGFAAVIVALSTLAIVDYTGQKVEAMIARADIPDATADQPSVILLSVDTLRPDYLGFTGGPSATPAIDQFAAESYVFTQARSVAPWTRPSFASFFSGLYPSQMGVARTRGEDKQWEAILPALWREDVDMLAERMGEAGWATAAITTNPHLAAWTHAGQGFQVHHDLPVNGQRLQRRLLSMSPLTMLIPESSLPYGSALPLQRANRVTDATLRMLRGIDHRPLLLWSHFMDPHAPYDPPGLSEDEALLAAEVTELEAGRTHRTASERARITNAYVREVEYFDDWLGQIVEELKQTGLWDSAIVVLWSDHGEEFWEHGGWEHGQSFYDELLRVPLMVHMPGQAESQTFDQPVSLLDMMPTLLALCHLRVTDELQGHSLAQVLRGEDCELPEPRFFLEASHRGETRKGLLFGDYKLIYHVYQDSFELYDLAEDPGEKRDIYGTPDAPDTTTHEQELRDFTDVSFAIMEELAGTEGATELSPEARQQMKDLGYIQ